MRMSVVRLVPVLAMGLVACSTLVPPPAPAIGEPADPAAALRPDLIVAEPIQATPGEVVALTFPAETTRGIHFVLERLVDDVWVYEFDLLSDGPGPGWERRWIRAGGDLAIEDIGVGGVGPDRVVSPEVAAPGGWRICTGNAAQNICTTIEIVAAP